MTSAMRSTPTFGLEATLGIPPLDLHAKKLALNSVPRLFRANNWGRNPPPHTHRHHLWKEYNTYAPNVETTEKKTFRVNRLHLNTTPHENPDFSVYTDGSKTTQGTGFGWCITQSDFAQKETYAALDPSASVYMAEVVALISATNQLLEPEFYNKRINIWSDSLSIINALSGAIATNPLIIELMDNLVLLENNTQITLNWIRGHSEKTGN